ncbi:substrate-binding domain-containing protein [Plectonema cf. radiosum LEGE 06105]|uniref:Substrate-binding domain-containing protein n=1 Tax=Plectonema cf. radiosum LEGE 06105 TaxID=945769 RepID=A0A8J7JVQ7_9CYAN|nr:substrate-binding domain-containing protein [Plectonema radiosum]MBE9216074.1 substrate-binding domain-containing protein [Plectonema cf. radiosum LEGE 06105]
MSSLLTFYKEYNCSYNAPLSCDQPLQTAQQIKGAKFCLECGFPATLPIESEIKGNRGSYRVTKFLGVRGLGRLYAGVQSKNQEPVIIKEYLLPSRCFNQDEALKRKETFKRVGGVNLADGRQQNFRLIQTWEAIADEKGERCYLITKDTEPSQTLGQYLIAQGAMKASQVREFLNQALQTLIFLHTQKLRFPSNQVQKGLEHGNISLDSILIKLDNPQFFLIYFCDLAKWENLFIPANFSQPPATTYQNDLESLGLVAFYLWLGRTTDYNTGNKINPQEHDLLPNTDNYLKQFIYHLLGFESPFPDAQTARQALLQLSPEQVNQSQPGSNLDLINQKRFPIYRVLLGILVLLLLGGGIWYYFWWLSKLRENKDIAWNQLLTNFSEVSNVTSGKFFYTSEKDGTWSDILRDAPVNSDTRLNDLLTKPKPEVEATFNYQSIDIKTDSKILIEEVRSGRKDFAITSLENIITDDMRKEAIAYDGLLVFVTLSKNKNSLPQSLQGKISLEQLRKIYTGAVTNWRQIDPKLPNLPIEAHVPQEAEAVEQFKRLVLKNNQDIALFEKIAKSQTEDTGTTQVEMREAINKREEIGIIGFGILSKTWDQCSGYPLAIVDRDSTPIQPLFRQVQKRRIEPSDTLCDKANYFDVDTFHLDKTAYPLGYPLYIVYPRDNSRVPSGLAFAEMLQTRQGQCLLNKVGLVPLQPIPSNIENNNACESVP